jgi:hypothetical protein
VGGVTAVVMGLSTASHVALVAGGAALTFAIKLLGQGTQAARVVSVGQGAAGVALSIFASGLMSWGAIVNDPVAMVLGVVLSYESKDLFKSSPGK